MENEIIDNLDKTEAPIDVLLVDDEIMNLRALQRMLRNENYCIELCNSGDEALEMTAERDFDVILMDIMMPGISGLEACRIIHERKPDLPIIIVTALIDDMVIKEAFDSGAADYLRKPLNYTEIVVRIRNCVGVRRANARTVELYNRLLNDVDAAAEIQKCLTPDPLIAFHGLDCSSIYLPAEKVSGDVFDIIPLAADQCLIYIGDISGHGVQSAMLTAAVKTLIRMEAERVGDEIDFYRVAISIIHQLEQLFQRKYMTFILGCFDCRSGVMEYINCGHPPIMKYSHVNKQLRKVDGDGSIPIGWQVREQNSAPVVNRLLLDDGDMLFWYSDGMFECVDSNGKMPGIDELREHIAAILPTIANRLMLPEVLCCRLKDAGFRMETDDCMMLTMRFRKTPGRELLLKVCPELSGVCVAGHRCEQAIIAWTKNSKLAARCELVVVEFINNIIIHGQTVDDIYLRIEHDKDVKLSFYDHGIEWEFSGQKMGQNNEVKSELMAESGRGMNMIRTLASGISRIRYGSINETVITIGGGE